MIKKWFQKSITILTILALLAEPALAAPLTGITQETAVDTEYAEEAETEEAAVSDQGAKKIEEQEELLTEAGETDQVTEEAEEPEELIEYEVSEESEETPEEEADPKSENEDSPDEFEDENGTSEPVDLIDPENSYFEPSVMIPEIEDDGTWENVGKQSGLSEFASKKLLRDASLPAKYDARDAGNVSSVKDQGRWGACWAFQAVSAAESSILIAGGSEQDLSELQLVEFAFNGARGGNGTGDRQELISDRGDLQGDYTTSYKKSKVQIGANGLMAMFALNRWTGLGAESRHSSMAYDLAKTGQNEMDAIPNEYAFADDVHLENGYIVPLSDRDAVKQKIMEYGSCGIDIYYNSYYDSSHTAKEKRSAPDDICCMYCDLLKDNNHAVSVVGWDDDFQREYFADTRANIDKITDGKEPVLPTQNGAWLVKNSYGTTTYGKGNDGYVWISYENASFQDYVRNNGTKVTRTAKVFDFSDADNYDHIYQYDGTIDTTAYKIKHAAARYHTMNAPEMLRAAGIALKSANVDYTVSVYTRLSDPSDPESGHKAYTKSGRTEYAGYYTVKFDEEVLLLPDTDYAIVWDVNVDGDTATVYGEKTHIDKYDDGTSIEYTTHASENETFYRIESSKWSDAVNQPTSPVTYRLKAYTDDALFADTDTDISGVQYTFAEYEESEFTKTFDTKTYQPTVDLIFKGTVLREDVDYDVKYLPAKTDEFGNVTAIEDATALDAVSDAGIYQIRYEGKGLFHGQKIAPVIFTIQPKLLEDMNIETQMQAYQDDLSLYHPVAKVSWVCDGETIVLNEGIDYSVLVKSFSNKTGSGTLTGTGNYCGELTIFFSVNEIPISLADAETKVGYVRYDQNVHGLTMNVSYAGSKLRKNNDYKMWYVPAKREGEVLVQTGAKTSVPVNAGLYQIRLEGRGDFAGVSDTESVMEIVPASIEEATVRTVSQKYGSVYDPVTSVYVLVGSTKKELVRGEDYEYDSSDISVSGTSGTVMLHGIGNYNDTVIGSFTLTEQIPISKVTVSPIPDQVYDGGRVIKPVPLLQYRPNSYAAYTVLTEGDDYTLQYQNNASKGIGNYKITITGKGKYYGTKTVTYRIVSRPYSFDRFSIAYEETEDGIPVAGYTKSGASPKLTIKYQTEDEEQVKLDEGTDFTLSLSKNTKLTAPGTLNLPTVTIRFKGNYKGSAPAQTFVIKPNRNLTDEVGAVKINDMAAGRLESVPVVTDINGKQLVNNKDYQVSYFYAEDTELAGGEHRTAGTQIATGEKPVAGSRIGIRLDGINYKGSLSYLSDETQSRRLIYRIFNKSIAKAVANRPVKTCPAEIPEGGITISKADLTVKYAGQVVPNEDYEIVPGSYQNNTKAGTAYVMIRGLNEYGGTKRIPFRIKAKELLKEELSVSVNNGEDVPYLKGGVNPSVTVKIGETVLMQNIDYTLAFSNHKSVRDKSDNKPPTVTVKGKGNYTGKVSYPFTIARQDLAEMLKETEGSKSSLVIKDMRYSKKTSAILAKPVLKDINGKQLSSSDYTVSYVYADPVVIGNRLITAGTEVAGGDIPPIGTKIRVEISGNGQYTGILDDPEKYDIVYRIKK